MTTTLQAMEEELAAIRSSLRELAANDNPSDEDVIVQDTLIKKYEDLETQVEPLRKRMAAIERIREVSGDPENTEKPFSGGTGPTVVVRSNSDPFEDLDRVRMNLVHRDDMRARALDVIERDNGRWDFPHDHAEEATRRAETNPGIAQHILLHGSREYTEAFRSYLADPMSNENRLRAVNLTNASGGYLLPYVLDPTIVLTNNASANPFRRVSRVVQTTSNAWQGVSSAGINAALVAEAATAADAAPTDFAQIQVSPKKFAAWVLGSYEALDDTDFGQQLPGLLADAKDRIESSYFATGSGTNAPLGIVVGLGTSGRVVPTATGTAFGTTANIKDIGLLMAALAPRFRRSPACAFMANIAHINNIRAMDQYGGGGFWANLTNATPPSLYGYPIYEGSDLPSVTTGTSAASGTANDTLFMGDWNQFIIADRVGVSMLYDPLIKGTGASAQLPQGQAGWYMFWRTGSTVATTAAFAHLTVS